MEVDLSTLLRKRLDNIYKNAMSYIIINNGLNEYISTEPSQCHFEYIIVMPYRYKSQELICQIRTLYNPNL